MDATAFSVQLAAQDAQVKATARIMGWNAPACMHITLDLWNPEQSRLHSTHPMAMHAQIAFTLLILMQLATCMHAGLPGIEGRQGAPGLAGENRNTDSNIH
jgi:hypothetical protein